MAATKSVSVETLRELVDAGSVRTLQAVRTGTRWALVARVGLDERVLRSQREDVRLFARLDTIHRFTRELGVNRFEVVER